MARIALIDDESQFITFESTLTEDHSASASITDHPIEDGASESDHVTDMPDELQLTGLVSDTPIILLPSLFRRPSVPGGDPASRPENAWEFLKNLKKQRKPLRVATTLEEYKNMIITRLRAPRSKNTRNILQVDVTLRQINRAKTETDSDPEPQNESRSKQDNRGKQTRDDPEEPVEEDSTSLLRKIFDSVD